MLGAEAACTLWKVQSPTKASRGRRERWSRCEERPWLRMESRCRHISVRTEELHRSSYKKGVVRFVSHNAYRVPRVQPYVRGAGRRAAERTGCSEFTLIVLCGERRYDAYCNLHNRSFRSDPLALRLRTQLYTRNGPITVPRATRFYAKTRFTRRCPHLSPRHRRSMCVISPARAIPV